MFQYALLTDTMCMNTKMNEKLQVMYYVIRLQLCDLVYSLQFLVQFL